MFSTNNLPASAFYSWNYMGYYTNTRATGLALAVTDEHSAGYLPVQPHLIDNAVLVNETHNRLVGDKSYELADHLGDVRAIVSDRKTGFTFSAWPVSTTSLNNLMAEISGVNNYYAGGMLQPGRSFSSSDYRYGFNGQEKDDVKRAQKLIEKAEKTKKILSRTNLCLNKRQTLQNMGKWFRMVENLKKDPNEGKSTDQIRKELDRGPKF